PADVDRRLAEVALEAGRLTELEDQRRRRVSRGQRDIAGLETAVGVGQDLRADADRDARTAEGNVARVAGRGGRQRVGPAGDLPRVNHGAVVQDDAVGGLDGDVRQAAAAHDADESHLAADDEGQRVRGGVGVAVDLVQHDVAVEGDRLRAGDGEVGAG